MKIKNNPSKIKLSDSSYKLNKISKNIRNRRSVYANQFIKGELPDQLLEEILTNATWAPTHKMTEPWRFIVFRGKYLKKYGEYMAHYYKDFYTELSPEDQKDKLSYLENYPLNAACMIGVVLVKNTKIDLPEWEEIAAVSSAVQNIALTCHAHKMGSYWSTKGVAIDYVAKFGLSENEKSLGLLYLGYYPEALKPSKKKRTPLSKKVVYLD
ncbi:nitroreductase family protein [Flavobacterium tructae]|uniref:Nitroreductase n=1 Tax=Flavobacterium tructae TaxID=1114873 RepID=A0A1S1J404_9FLAO|nr:nitroreductase [Flavobacterium tructae]MDL2142579.1 nitroreductase [Flavobacterium tructae]OHT43916.1 nitroreductase [Flavobacterium tructae]OXB21570.1 nitroreductase [Flavobacterium tructae]OXB25297.1 nitroreductase [Flavobacterium tructae]